MPSKLKLLALVFTMVSPCFTSFIYGKEILVASNAETNNDYEWLHVCHVRPRSLRAHMLHGKAKYQLLWVGPRALWPRDVV